MIGFEAAQGSSCCCGLGNPVAPADAFELPLPHHFHRDSDLAVVRPLSRAIKKPNSLNQKSELFIIIVNQHGARALRRRGRVRAEGTQRKRA